MYVNKPAASLSAPLIDLNSVFSQMYAPTVAGYQLCMSCRRSCAVIPESLAQRIAPRTNDLVGSFPLQISSAAGSFISLVVAIVTTRRTPLVSLVHVDLRAAFLCLCRILYAHYIHATHGWDHNVNPDPKPHHSVSVPFASAVRGVLTPFIFLTHKSSNPPLTHP